MTSDFELSVVVTAHDETLVSGPTMAAADAAIDAAIQAGITVERVIALDCATEKTKRWFCQPRFDHWQRLTLDQGDLGRTRNAVLKDLKGHYVAFLDADDLFSESWLREGVLALRAAEDMGEKAIAHPELNWLFDGAHSVYAKLDSSDPLFSPYHFYSMNYYDSLCMAPRAAHENHPYVSRDIPAGLSFQDWQFAIETLDAGWRHLSVKNTIIFKRRRDNSLVSESRDRRAVIRQLDAMSINKVSELGSETTTTTKGVLGRLKSFMSSSTSTPNLTPSAPENPHYGAVLAARIDRAKAKKGNVPPEVAPVLDAIRPYFDHAYYLATYDDIYALEDVDPVAHYVRAGWKEGRNPTPWFDTRAYLNAHPEVEAEGKNPFYHWLITHKATNAAPLPVPNFDAIAEMLGHSPKEAFALWHDRFSDIRERFETGELGLQVKRAADFEPLIELGWLSAVNLKIPPFHTQPVTDRTVAIWRLLNAAGRQPARFVICVNRARFGSNPRVEGQIARALSDGYSPHDVLVITTDQPGPMPTGKLPSGVRHVDFAELVPSLRGDPRQRVLIEFLRALAPDCVFNINARLLWDALGPYGDALSASTRIYACLLCNEQSAVGYWTGYPLRRTYRHFDQLTGIFTDSAFLADDLITRHAIPPEDQYRVHALPNPVDPTIPLAAKPSNDRPKIFWAGRLDRQKRVDLLFAIAEAMPQADFHVWGEVVMGGAPLPPGTANLHLEGKYDTFLDVPIDTADMWLYTSAWDGVPTMLLEVAMTGVPIVASDVGGTKEALPGGAAQTMPPDASLSDWVASINAVLQDPDEYRAHALSLRAELLQSRTARIYQDQLAAFLKLTS